MRWIKPISIAVLITLSSVVAAGEEETGPRYDARLSDYRYPFEVHRFEFQSQRQTLQMAYMHLPADKARPTVLLLHGKNFSGAYWERTAEYFHKRGYGVLMPDQIGFGKSSKPAHYQFSLPALAAHTRALVDRFELDRVIVMGHSMGGMLAARYSLMYADAVEKLVLVNPIGLEDYLDYVEYRDPAFFYAREKDKTVEAVRAYQKQHYYDGAWSPAYEELIEIHKGWIQGPDWERVAWNNALTYDMIFTANVVDEFGELEMPVHLIIGTRDTTGPGRGWKKPGVEYELGRYDRLGKTAEAAIPDATLHEIDGVGHLPQFEAFDRYREKLDRIFTASN